MVDPGEGRRVSNLGVLALCSIGGAFLGVGSVFVLTWGDSYERVDSLIGMAVMGTAVGLVIGLMAVVGRAALRRN